MTEIDPELLKRLDTVAAKLGVTADHMWGVLVRQAYVIAYSDLVWAAVDLAFVAMVAAYIWKQYRKWAGSGDKALMDSSGRELMELLSCVLLFILSLGFFLNGLSDLNKGSIMLANPENYALHQVLDLGKN